MCSVSWMAVLGQLKSLRLDFDRDHLIAAAEFPPGALVRQLWQPTQCLVGTLA